MCDKTPLAPFFPLQLTQSCQGDVSFRSRATVTKRQLEERNTACLEKLLGCRSSQRLEGGDCSTLHL